MTVACRGKEVERWRGGIDAGLGRVAGAGDSQRRHMDALIAFFPSRRREGLLPQPPTRQLECARHGDIGHEVLDCCISQRLGKTIKNTSQYFIHNRITGISFVLPSSWKIVLKRFNI